MQTDLSKHSIVDDYFNQCRDGLCVIDRNEHYVAWNPAVERISGVRKEDALGKYVFDLFPFLEKLGEREIHARVFAGETVLAEPRPYDFVERRRRGHYQALYSPWFDESGKIQGILVSVRDVGTSINSMLAIQNLSQVLGGASDPKEILEIMMESIFEVAKPTAVFVMLFERPEKVFSVLAHRGYPEGSIDPNRKVPLDNVWPGAIAVQTGRPVIVRSLEEAERNHSLSVREAIEKSGAKAYAAIPWIVEGQAIGSVGICFASDSDISVETINLLQTITSQCAQSYERARSYHLEHEARAAAEAADNAKTKFLANVSHELRTPLTVILGYAELLQTGFEAFKAKAPAEKLNSFVDGIVRNSRSLTRIIEDLLDLSKVESGRIRIRPEKIELYPWITEIVNTARQLASAKKLNVEISIKPDVPKTFESDPQRIKQILMNLISNAVKFTPSGTVRMSVHFEREGDEPTIEFTVNDEGIGIVRQHELFEPFAKPIENNEGSGLGLAIASRLARALGGKLRLMQTGPQQGSTFQLSIPYVKSASTDIGGERRSLDTPCLTNLNLLLAEDNDDVSKLLMNILRREGARVTLARDGAEAIEKSLEEDFDIILLDIQMPRINGYEAARQMRESAILKPIVALTAHAFQDYRDEAVNVGFDAFVPKPIDRFVLCETILRLTKS